MGVNLCSIFRDSVDDIDRYFTQVDKLEAHLGESVRLVVAEGDSTDGTYDMLAAYLIGRGSDDVLLKVDHGGPKYGSVDHPDRWARIALVCNRVMEAAAPLPGPKVYVESDLIWEPTMVETLLEDLAIVPAVSPLSMQRDRFYDVFGFRGLDGMMFAGYEPYHQDLIGQMGLVEIGSAGSCIVMREEIARVARFGEADCIIGLGRSIREHGGGLYLDRRVSVQHP